MAFTTKAADAPVRRAHWRESKRFGNTFKLTLSYIVLTFGAFLLIIPFIWMVTTSIKGPVAVMQFPPLWIPGVQFEPLWENYPTALLQDHAPFGIFFRNTFVITALAMAGQIISSAVVAFSFARLRWKGREFVFFIVLATIMLPQQVTLVPQFILFRNLGWINTFLPLIVPFWLGVGNAFFIFLLRQFFMRVPLDYDDAARIDGAGTFQIFWRIVMPLSLPALGTVAIFSFINHWNEFFHALIYLNEISKYNLALGLTQFRGFTRYEISAWNLLMAASLTALVPVLLVFFFAQRYFIQGIVISGVKG
ncbi:MAG: carbohydrate ABC transporter permease [Chloroflexi bacterium]|nr:carbohydrate ABC transporter permease [Chloroflexota bacterium]MCY3936844.1 carbohydrate ABC transporter permease [Chloroflexota bacterium]